MLRWNFRQTNAGKLSNLTKKKNYYAYEIDLWEAPKDSSVFQVTDSSY